MWWALHGPTRDKHKATKQIGPAWARGLVPHGAMWDARAPPRVVGVGPFGFARPRGAGAGTHAGMHHIWWKSYV